MSHRIVLSMGSNLGDSVGILEQATDEMSEFIGAIRASSHYLTKPVGGLVQPDFVNAVLIGETDLAPEELLVKLQEIENRHGRERVERWGARTLDIDLIDFDSITWHSGSLSLPHPRAHERAFVLIPWLELDPNAVLVGHGRVQAILATLDASGVIRK